jgi:hypothetical protein
MRGEPFFTQDQGGFSESAANWLAELFAPAPDGTGDWREVWGILGILWSYVVALIGGLFAHVVAKRANS